jgi:nitrogen fixation NifU-like protein
MTDLYHALIVEHDRAPHHHGPLANATHTATLDNPLCGDVITLRLIVDGDQIRDLAFEARGCALSRAAASLMTDRVLGAPIDTLGALAARFEQFVQEPIDAAVPAELGELAAFVGLRGVRSRRGCATLPFRALIAALTDRRPPTPASDPSR